MQLQASFFKDLLVGTVGTDQELKKLHSLVTSGAPEEWTEWPEEIKKYYSGREYLDTIGGVVTYKGRLVVPKQLRPAALEILHSCHQGASTMVHSAADTLYWPGMCSEVRETRKSCRFCDVTAPSQAAAPPVDPPQPDYPFQHVCCDFFQCEGKTFCVLVDRYSNWISIYRAEKKSAEEQVNELRSYVTTFGIMEEISTDGGPQFTS